MEGQLSENMPKWTSCKRLPFRQNIKPLTDHWSMRVTRNHLVILPDAVHCACVPWGAVCKMQKQYAGEVCGTLKLGSVCWADKNPTSVMKLRSSQLCRRSTQWTVNHTTRHLTLAPAMHCACFSVFVQVQYAKRSGHVQCGVGGALKLKSDYYPYT